MQIWTWCRKYAKEGEAVLPDPQKGPLDQDAELMLAFEVLEEIAEELEHEEQIRSRARQLAKDFAQ